MKPAGNSSPSSLTQHASCTVSIIITGIYCCWLTVTRSRDTEQIKYLFCDQFRRASLNIYVLLRFNYLELTAADLNSELNLALDSVVTTPTPPPTTGSLMACVTTPPPNCPPPPPPPNNQANSATDDEKRRVQEVCAYIPHFSFYPVFFQNYF